MSETDPQPAEPQPKRHIKHSLRLLLLVAIAAHLIVWFAIGRYIAPDTQRQVAQYALKIKIR